jgi:hypothetical protein
MTNIDKKLVKNCVDWAINNNIKIFEPQISKSTIFEEEGIYSVPTTVLHRKHKVAREYMDLARNIDLYLKTVESQLITSC